MKLLKMQLNFVNSLSKTIPRNPETLQNNIECQKRALPTCLPWEELSRMRTIFYRKPFRKRNSTIVVFLSFFFSHQLSAKKFSLAMILDFVLVSYENEEPLKVKAVT